MTTTTTLGYVTEGLYHILPTKRRDILQATRYAYRTPEGVAGRARIYIASHK